MHLFWKCVELRTALINNYYLWLAIIGLRFLIIGLWFSIICLWFAINDLCLVIIGLTWERYYDCYFPNWLLPWFSFGPLCYWSDFWIALQNAIQNIRFEPQSISNGMNLQWDAMALQEVLLQYCRKYYWNIAGSIIGISIILSKELNEIDVLKLRFRTVGRSITLNKPWHWFSKSIRFILTLLIW